MVSICIASGLGTEGTSGPDIGSDGIALMRSCPLVVHRRFMEIFCEDIRRNCGTSRRNFGWLIGGLVVTPCNVVELEAMELVFQTLELLAIHLHLGVVVARCLHYLVNDEQRVTSDVKSLDSKLDHDV